MTRDKFSTENLIKLLDIIKEGVESGKIDQHLQESIWDSLLWDKNDPDNKEMTKYLFTGWWVHYNLNNKPLEIDETTKEFILDTTELRPVNNDW